MRTEDNNFFVLNLRQEFFSETFVCGSRISYNRKGPETIDRRLVLCGTVDKFPGMTTEL